MCLAFGLQHGTTILPPFLYCFQDCAMEFRFLQRCYTGDELACFMGQGGFELRSAFAGRTMTLDPFHHYPNPWCLL